MKPFFFEHTLFETPTYFLLYCFAFLGALVLMSALARKRGLNAVQAIDLGIISFVFGVGGARLFHILFENPGYYLLHPIRVFYLWQGGFVLYGGLIAGIGAGWIYVRKNRLDWRVWGDLAAGPILLGIGIGRMGCLAAGCCYGKPTDGWWGLMFTDPRTAAPLHVWLHPTQLIEAVSCLLLALVVSRIYVKRSTSERSGTLFLNSLTIYAVLRFMIEFLRGDADRVVYWNGNLSTSQIVSIFAVVLLVFLRPRRNGPVA